MVSEGEVTCGVIKWIFEKIKHNLDQNKGIETGFWIDQKSFTLICEFLEIDKDFTKFLEKLITDFKIDSSYFKKHFLGIKNFNIPWGDHNLIPDIVVHNYYTSAAYSETWAIECKGDNIDSIKRGYLQVIGHGGAVSKSYIALAEEEENSIIDLINLGYGVLLYNSNAKNVSSKGNVLTKANAELLSYFNKYIRDLHLKEGKLPFIYGKPFIQRRIAPQTNLSLALYIYYNQKSFKENPIDLATSFLSGVSNVQPHIDDLKNLELINDNYEVSDRAKSFFYLLDNELTGANSTEKIKDFNKRFPSIQSNKILFKESKFGFFIANLLKIFLTSNKSIQEFTGWVSQAFHEAGNTEPIFAHVITIGIKQNPLLISEMLFYKRSNNIPSFQFNLSRTKPNVCAVCEQKDKIDFCFCGGDKKVMFKKKYTNLDERIPFQECYNEFHEVWNEIIPIEIVHRKDLHEKYIKVFKYDTKKEVEILAPCFIKFLLDTNINKTTAFLKHIGILGEKVRSGLKAEVCPRFDLMYLNPKMEWQEEIS